MCCCGVGGCCPFDWISRTCCAIAPAEREDDAVVCAWLVDIAHLTKGTFFTSIARNVQKRLFSKRSFSSMK